MSHDNTMSHKDDSARIEVPDAPAIPGLTFRYFRGEVDYPAIATVNRKSIKADQIAYKSSVEEIARGYSNLYNCDPYKDMLFVEIDGKVIGYSRVWWEKKPNGTRIYVHLARLLPEWRGKGIRRAMLRFNERRAREIAAEHPSDNPSFFECRLVNTETHWESLLTSEHYRPVRYFFSMACFLDEDVPELPLPKGLEVRPVNPEHYKTVWKAVEEAVQDEWEGSSLAYEEFKHWMGSPTFNPELWQVAWDANSGQVAGVVLNLINERKNQKYRKKYGYIMTICVRRPWRKKGLAKALIARSFKAFKERGVTEIYLEMDAENPSDTLRLYEPMGFYTVSQSKIYRKSLDKKGTS